MYAYMILRDKVHVYHSKVDKNGKIKVKFLDKSMGVNRQLTVELPDMLVVSSNNMFNQGEIQYLLRFAKNNYKLMAKYALLGGVNNA